ncbi:MAG: HEAT repeat domain-containing protein [Chloroflexota bacterium]
MLKRTDRTIQAILLLLVGQMFFLAYAFSLLNIAAYSLFLTFFDSENLAYVYIAIAIFVSLVSFGYINLQSRWTLSRLGTTTVFGFALLYFAAWLLLRATQASWLAFVLMVAVTLLELLGMILIGNQAGRLFDVRQMKRLYPTVISGMLAGYMAGGATTTLLVRLLGSTENLLLVCGASTLITLALLIITIRRFPEAYQAAEAASDDSKPARSVRQLLDKKYIRAVFSYQMLSAIGTQLVIFLYFTLADARYESAEELAQFFGTLTIVREVVSLAFTGLVAGRLLNRFGMGFGLTANPIVVGSMILIMAVLGLVWGWSFTGFFWLAVAAYILDVMLSDGTTSTSVKTSYQALPADEQTMVETTVEGIGVPVAYGFTGVLLLILSLLPTQSLLPFMVVAVVVALLWAMMALMVYRDYAGTLIKTLSRRALNTVALSLNDSASLQIVERLLASEKVGEVRLALDVLEGGEREILSARLLSLVKQQTPAIRREALQRLEKHQIEAGLPLVREILANEQDPQVRGTAVRTLCALAEDDLVETVQPFLEDGTSATSVGAIVGLLRYGGISGVLAAGQQLTKWQASPEAEERRVAAEAIGEVGVALAS